MKKRYTSDDDDVSSLKIRFNPKREHVQRKKERKGKRVEVTQEQANATVTSVFPKQCRVLPDDKQKEVLAVYRRAQLLDPSKDDKERAPLTVGDRVVLSNAGVIEAVAKRINVLIRPAPGRSIRHKKGEYDPVESSQIHTIAANLDELVVICSAVEPRFSESLIDRYLIAAKQAGIPICVVLTKTDQLESPQHQEEKTNVIEWIAFYRSLQIPIFLTTVHQPSTLEPLKDYLLKKRVAFCGHSGVGKTSLLSALLKYEIGKIQDINEITGKGRHTTSTSILYLAEELSPESKHNSRSEWIDTPGIREFGLVGIHSSTLMDFFPELQNLSCNAHGCNHGLGLEENRIPECSATRLKRWPSFLRIRQSLLEFET